MSAEIERIYGMLLGCAVGDAMGMPAEMWSRQKIADYFGQITTFLPGPPENEISAGLSAYETTDDTIVTTIVARMLLDTGGSPDPLELVHRIERWAQENPKSRTIIGPSTRRAFDQIARGVPVAEAGRMGETNGAAMRISPVGAISSYLLPEQLADRVQQVCLATHNTASAISGACAVAAAVSHGIAGRPLAEMPAAALAGARAGAKRGYELCSPSVAERIAFLIDLSGRTEQDQAFLERVYNLNGCGLPSTESVPAAIALAYRAGEDLMRCAQMCANLGGDTDTIGAIAGAIAGAHGGAAGLDPALAQKIQQVNGFDFRRLAEELAALRARCVADE